jgi:hypothetical protein
VGTGGDTESRGNPPRSTSEHGDLAGTLKRDVRDRIWRRRASVRNARSGQIHARAGAKSSGENEA